MNRTVLIVVGVAVILLVLGVWVYLLLFGTPDNPDDVFTNLGGDTTPRVEAPTVITPPDPAPTVETTTGLQQLTTRPVAGFVIVSSASTTIVRYAEQGTGHIYDINLKTGTEEFISRTTIPRIREAVFSPDGTAVALTSITGYDSSTVAGTIENGSLNGQNLVPNAANLYLPDANTVRYTTVSDAGISGFEYNLASGAQTQFFLFPLTAVHILWQGSNIYAVTKPADELMGYVYKLTGNTFSSLPINGYGLLTESANEHMAYSAMEDGQLTSKVTDLVTNEVFASPVQVVPEKCTFAPNDLNTIWCAAPLGSELTSTNWYTGEYTANDLLWQLNVIGQEAILILDFEATSGRAIDVSDLTINNDANLLVFLNSRDNTLWKYDGF